MLAVLIVVLHGHAFLIGKNMGMHARIVATAAIYQKVRAGRLAVQTKGERERESGSFG